MKNKCYFCTSFYVFMKEIAEKTIDIEQILRGKMGAKAKFVPGFLVNWLKRIVHEDEVNRFLWESRHLTGTEWLEECVRAWRIFRQRTMAASILL